MGRGPPARWAGGLRHEGLRPRSCQTDEKQNHIFILTTLQLKQSICCKVKCPSQSVGLCPRGSCSRRRREPHDLNRTVGQSDLLISADVRHVARCASWGICPAADLGSSLRPEFRFYLIGPRS